MKFQNICLYETGKVPVSAFTISSGVINPIEGYQRLTLSKALNTRSTQKNHEQRNYGNESKNLTTSSRPFLISRRILRPSSGETFLNKSYFAGCKGHSLKAYSTVSS